MLTSMIPRHVCCACSGQIPQSLRTARVDRGLAQQRRGARPVVALRVALARRVAVGERLDQAVVGTLAAQDHPPVALDQLGVEAGAAVRADRPGRRRQGVAPPHAKYPSACRTKTMTHVRSARPRRHRCSPRGAALVARAGLTLDIGIGRRIRPLGPIALDIAAPPEVVFDVIAAPYLGRTPRAMRTSSR